MLLWTYIVLAFVVLNCKSLPLAWCGRFYYYVIKNLVIKGRQYHKKGDVNAFGIDGQDKYDVFKATTYKTYVSFMEIDPYLHKSNSTYFSDLDVARCDTITKVFQKSFLDAFHNKHGEFKGTSVTNFPYCPIGTVECTFKRELKLFQRYDIVSKVFAWDNKWIYVISKFVARDKVCAIALTKYVFKKGRITIRPVELIKRSNLYNDEAEAVNAENYLLVKHMARDDLETIAEAF